MKKLLMIFLITLLMPFVVNAETTVKIGAGIIYRYRITKEHEITIFSWELKLERSLYKNFGLGFGFRKETIWGYDGYYLSLCPTQKISLSKRSFVAVSLGAEYGIPSSKYDNYRIVYDQEGNLIFHKWIYLVQNISIPGDFIKGNTGTIYPFGTISYGVRIWKGLSIETGLKVQMLRFGVKSSIESSIEDKKNWKFIPSFFVQIGIIFSSKKK